MNIFKKLLSLLPRQLYVGYNNKSRADNTLVLLHGLGCTHEVWQPFIENSSQKYHIIALDLLGFGNSPKPNGVMYSNLTQAKAVIMTLKNLGIRGQVVVVGHSMGALVAAEIARIKPDLCQQIILCGPPIYRGKMRHGRVLSAKAASDMRRNHISHHEEKILTQLYKLAAVNINQDEQKTLAAIKLMRQLDLTPRGLEINQQTLPAYIASLKSSILRQKTYQTLKRITIPTTILYGWLDPLVIAANVKDLAKLNPNINTKQLVAGHELSKSYLKRINKICQ